MKRIFFFVFISVLSMPMRTNASTNIKQEIRALEQELDTDDATMYTMIHVRDIKNGLSDVCDTNVLDDAKNRVNIILARLEARYGSMNDAEILYHSWILYERLREQHLKTGDTLSNTTYYCTVKYIMYEVQQYLRDAHLGIFEKTDIIKDFGGFDVDTLYGFTTKRRYLDVLIKNLHQYKGKLGTTLTFSVKNKDFKDTLSDQQKDILERAQEIMELSVYKVLVDLKQAGLFTTNDVAQLKNKIIFEYVDLCGSVNGKYEVKETLTSAGEHIRYETDALYLKVNLCGNFFMLRDMSEVYEKIVTHELAHHLFYFHDRLGNKEFLDICRSGNGENISGCSTKDFVSKYARTHGNEDYAEHFMFWFLNILPAQSSIMRKKTNHFEALLK